MTVNEGSVRKVEVKIDLRHLRVPLHCPRASAVGWRRTHRPGPHPNDHALRLRGDIYMRDLVAIAPVPDVMDKKLFAVGRRLHSHDGRVVEHPEPRTRGVSPAGRVECYTSGPRDGSDARQSDYPPPCHPRDGTAANGLLPMLVSCLTPSWSREGDALIEQFGYAASEVAEFLAAFDLNVSSCRPRPYRAVSQCHAHLHALRGGDTQMAFGRLPLTSALPAAPGVSQLT